MYLCTRKTNPVNNQWYLNLQFIQVIVMPYITAIREYVPVSV